MVTFSSFIWSLDHQLNYAFWLDHHRMPCCWKRKCSVLKTYQIMSLQSLSFPGAWSLFPAAGWLAGVSPCVSSSLAASFFGSPEGLFPASSECGCGSDSLASFSYSAVFFFNSSIIMTEKQTRPVTRPRWTSQVGLFNWSNALKPDANVPM